MKNSTTSAAPKKRKINKSYRFANLGKDEKTGQYKIGKTQAELLEKLPKRKEFTRKDVREIAIANLGLTRFRTNQVLDGLKRRNFIVSDGRIMRRGKGLREA